MVLFLKSGAPYGYGYAEGETGEVRAEDVPRLTSAGVIQVIVKAEKEPKTEQATDKTTREKR